MFEMSKKSDRDREAMLLLQGPPQEREQESEALELIIPCRQGKPDKIFPEYLVKTNALNGPEKSRYRCLQCGGIFHNRRAWEKHKGINWIHASGIKVCQ